MHTTVDCSVGAGTPPSIVKRGDSSAAVAHGLSVHAVPLLSIKVALAINSWLLRKRKNGAAYKVREFFEAHQSHSARQPSSTKLACRNGELSRNGVRCRENSRSIQSNCTLPNSPQLGSAPERKCTAIFSEPIECDGELEPH